MDYFPIFCQLAQKPCLVVGGGVIAERKARLLIDAGAQLTVVALSFTPQFLSWQQAQKIRLIQRAFTDELINHQWLVIAATNNDAVNQQVYQAANARQTFCNVVDSPQQASFIMPSIIDRSPIMVAISSGGKAPVLARILREKLEVSLPQHLGRLAELAGSLRDTVKARFSRMSQRRQFWERFFTHPNLAQSVADQHQPHIQASLNQLFDAQPSTTTPQGSVVLVGAGPGDPGLLTLKGLQHIQQADVVIYDRLVSEPVMQLVRRDAERIFVGKRAGDHCVPQTQINQLLLQHAQQGKRVVRLKGGDPFIFGRGAEELALLVQHQINFSVVPGITAASGCSTYAGIPLTHRDHAQSVRFITGHGKDITLPEWRCLAVKNQTLVFYMGLTKAPLIEASLLAQNMAPTTPVAIIENGTLPNQKVVTGKLQHLAHLAQQCHSPALIIVGEVVNYRASLHWFSS